MVIRPDHETAVYVEHTLGLSRSAACVEDEKGVFGVHHLGFAVDTPAGQKLIEVDLFLHQGCVLRLPTPHHDVLQMVDVFRCFVAYAFEVDGLATPVSEVRGYHYLSLCI